MSKKVLFLVVLLGIVLLLASCPAPGGVGLMDAQMSYLAVVLMGFDAVLLQSSPPGIDIVPPVTGPGELKRANAAGTLVIDLVPTNLAPPSTNTTTASSYIDSTFGYVISGTIVSTIATVGGDQTSTFNLNLSNGPVNTITGTLVESGTVTSGTLYFNGTGYTYNQLNGL